MWPDLLAGKTVNILACAETLGFKNIVFSLIFTRSLQIFFSDEDAYSHIQAVRLSACRG
jgi:hypothetical protein